MTAEQMRTKNEVGESTVMIPEIEEVGEDEVLDKVGEVMSIIDKVVIVKGTPSQVQSRGSEKALDSDTLLVFEDRKVLGYVSMLLCNTVQFVLRLYPSVGLGNVWSHTPAVLSRTVQ